MAWPAAARLDPVAELPVALVWRRDRHASPVARAFVDFVRSARG